MCRPAKRPKPLVQAAVMPAFVVQEKGDQIQQMVVPKFGEDFSSQQELFSVESLLKSFPVDPIAVTTSAPSDAIDEPFMSLADLLESEEDELFESQPSTPCSGNEEQDDYDSRPKTFVFTTYDMVSNLANAAAIGFNAEGTALEIRDIRVLSESILPRYFRHRNVTSFYRQLNSYGFRTVKSASAEIAHTFTHELFKQGQPEMLSSIVRKKCNPREKKERRTKRPAPVSSSEEPAELVPAVSSPSSSSSSGGDESPEDSVVREPAAVAPVVVVEKAEKVIFTKPVHVETQVANPARDVAKLLAELRSASAKVQERSLALEARNRRIAEENKAMLVESDYIFRSMNRLVDNQTSIIEKLFGEAASLAFADQARPFRFDFAEAPSSSKVEQQVKQAPSALETQAQDFTEFVLESNDLLFQDDDLELMENIFSVDEL